MNTAFAPRQPEYNVGIETMSVVDGNLKVYGIENLRIADGSLMSRITTGNIVAAWVIIGERQDLDSDGRSSRRITRDNYPSRG
jgi:GMC oxidoreductase